MSNKKPLVILLGSINVIIALIGILLSIYPNLLDKLNFTELPLPFFSCDLIKIPLYIFLLISSYNFLKFKKWSYWAIIIYQIFFLLISTIWGIKNRQLFF